MKRTVLFLIILFTVGFVSQAQENPFKQYGVKGEILTLSKGKYKEVFYNEEIMQIGTVKINTLTDKVVEFLELDTTEFAYRAEITSRFISVDPLAEEYYSWSPYVYVGNNPIKRIDPTGMDWYEDKDGSYQYDPKINKNSKLGEGQKYIGVTATVNDTKGNAFATFRKDGSIMFANEGAAYARMVTNSQKTGNEEMSVIADNGVLVLPSWDNKPDEAKFTEYGYSSKNGNVVDGLTGKTINTIAMAHTHPGGTMPSNADRRFVSDNIPNKPMYVFKMENKNDLTPGIAYIIANTIKPSSWNNTYSTTIMGVPSMTLQSVMTSGGLRSFTRKNRLNMINKIPNK